MFTYIRNHQRARRGVALFLALTHFLFLVEPNIAWALTSGPAQPEFSSFEPVVTTDMVNEFTGDFTYNLPVLEIPGPDGAGYALSLSYHSGTTPEEEASWVGYGWTLNPGAINRQMVGIPDDWSGQQVKYHNRAPKNKTVSVTTALGPEAMSIDELPFSLNSTLRYNNYTGFGRSAGVGVHFCSGVVSLGYQISDGNGSFSLTVNPAAALAKRTGELSKEIKAKEKELANVNLTDAECDALDKSITTLKSEKETSSNKQNRVQRLGKATSIASAYGMHALDAGTYPLSGQNMFGSSWTAGIGLNGTVTPVEIGVQGSLSGTLAIQENQAEKLRAAYGFLYHGSVPNGDDVMDYHTDNATTYNKRDKHLPQSYNDADLFVATGEGVVGSMRLHTDHPTSMRPYETNGSTTMAQLGVEINLGASIGLGFDAFTVGTQEMKQKSWTNGYNGNSTRTNEPFFFRMAGDKGGYVKNAEGTDPMNSSVSLNNSAQGYRTGSYAVPFAGYGMEMGGERNGRSSHVGFTTYRDLSVMRRYEKGAQSMYTNSPYSHTNSDLDKIAEISVLNENGKRYNYALPVFARNEKNLSFYAESGVNNRWTDLVNEQSSDFKSGTESEASYATTYLLTSVLEPNHIDRTENGPTPDDIGGYTKFYYERQGNFTWRSPYIGYMYSDPELSECSDNRAQFSSGEKEIKYLKRIETKSHVAIFSRSIRTDGRGIGASVPLEKLDRIDLYLRSDCDANGTLVNGAVPIRTVRFDYYPTNEGVWPSTPNVTTGNRLTLKRVRFESNGTNPARIAPYTFYYSYGAPNLGNHPAGGSLAPPANEDPAYDNFRTDPWGNYRADGGTRYSNLKPWLDQTPASTFDPAAWQLKRIKLPTGGEIHIHYEQDDYAYVQDEKAHVLAPLNNEHNANTDFFDVNVSELIAPQIEGQPPAFTREELISQLRDIYTNATGPQRKIFYKIMYLFEGTNETDCNGGRKREFITGYSTVSTVTATPDVDDAIRITVENNSRPQRVCEQQFKAEKRGKSRNSPCSQDALVPGGPALGGGPVDDIINFFDNAGSYTASMFMDNCSKICPLNSYLRVPVGTKKLGGGIRVKRLLMVDPQAVDAGYPAVFGTEYIYRTLDDRGRLISSGVASNEPAGIREENVLVRPLDRYKQSFLSRAVAGKDRKQVEGPIGESMYPGASVGYSRVIAKSIHDGRTAPAFTVNDFHTYKDHPIHVSMTDIERKPDFLPLPLGIVNIIRDNNYTSQGFTIHIPDMHGKPKKQASYNGNHRALLGQTGVFANLIASVETDYFAQGEKLPIMRRADGSIQIGTVEDHLPLGQEEDVCMETREILEKMNNGTVEVDGDVAVLPVPFPSGSAMVTVSHTLTRASTHTITKVVRYASTVKRTRSFKDGIYHVSQNIAFDPQTGNPIVVRTHDGFFPIDNLQTAALNSATNGIYTTVNIPSSMVYKNLGQVAAGERKMMLSDCANQNPTQCIACSTSTNTTATVTFESTSVAPGASCAVPKGLCIGDKLEITSNNNVKYHYHLDAITSNELHLIKAAGSLVLSNNVTIAKVEILRSGCANRLTENAGGFTYYGEQETANMPDLGARLAFVNYLNELMEMTVSGMLEHVLVDPEPTIPLAYAPTVPACLNYPQSTSTQQTSWSGHMMLSYWVSPFVYQLLGQGPFIDVNNPLVEVKMPPEICSGYHYFRYPGVFSLNDQGMLRYSAPDDCDQTELICPQFCGPLESTVTVSNVVSSSATAYSDEWDYETAAYASEDDLGPNAWPAGRNVYELGKRGKWRPSSHYAYMTPLTPGTKNYDQGMYDLQLFNYSDLSANVNTPWVRTDQVTHYSAEGHIEQELDALDRPSAARFGYHKMLPILVAQNSVKDLVLFESFENAYSLNSERSMDNGLVFSSLWPHGGRTSSTKHAGLWSYHSTAPNALLFNGPWMAVPSPNAPTLFNQRKMLVKCWIESKVQTGATEVTDLACTMTTIGGTTLPLSVPMERVARTGNWVQYSAIMPVSETATSIQFSISCTNPAGNATAIDDVRIQPVDAQMMAYVYDPKTLRLLTTFDDQHFGQYYQYNGEGKLVRKQIETERGLKTIQENHQNTAVQ